MVHQFDGFFDVACVQHFHRGVHVTQGNGNENRRAAIVCIGKAVCIGTGTAAQCSELHGDFIFFCHILYQA